MQTLGERLEEARKRKGLSIREAAEATKIRGDYLQKFEANSFQLDLPPLYVRGFVRAYARYLDFDAQRFLAEYDSVMAGDGRPPRRETRENYGRVEFGNEGGESTPGTRTGPDPMMLKYGLYGGGALVLIVVVIVLINVFSSSNNRPAPKQTSTENSAPTNPAVTAQNPNVPAQTLTFTASDQTRVKVVQDADERVIYEGTLSRGETRSFPKRGILRITVEDKTKLRIEVNGRAIQYPDFPSGGNYGRFLLD